MVSSLSCLSQFRKVATYVKHTFQLRHIQLAPLIIVIRARWRTNTTKLEKFYSRLLERPWASEESKDHLLPVHQTSPKISPLTDVSKSQFLLSDVEISGTLQTTFCIVKNWHKHVIYTEYVVSSAACFCSYIWPTHFATHYSNNGSSELTIYIYMYDFPSLVPAKLNADTTLYHLTHCNTYLTIKMSQLCLQSVSSTHWDMTSLTMNCRQLVVMFIHIPEIRKVFHRFLNINQCC